MSEKFNAIVHGDITPLAENVLVTNLDFGERVLASGIIIPDSDGKESGIKPRWCQVYKVGEKVDEVHSGEWVLVAHGRWSRGVKLMKSDGTTPVVRMVDRNDILMSSDTKPAA